MAEKTLRTKIALLYKTYAEWELAKDYQPLKGEVCICEVPAAAGAVVNEPAILIKVGNGVDTFENLSWSSALAADVYLWAKKEHLDWNDLDETFLGKLDAHIDAYFREELDGIKQSVEAEVTRATGVEEGLDEAIKAEAARAKAAEAKKPNIVEEGTNGTARLFNEKDGGGAKFEHKDGSEAFVGVNDGGKNGLMAQIYADIEENGQWVGSRINVFHDGIYYVSKAAQKAGAAKDDADREIATIGDIKALGKVLRFRGVFNSLDEVTNPEHGDVAIVGNKEYIYVVDGGIGVWKEFGDVSEYATKSELEAAVASLTAAIAAEETRAKAAEQALDGKISAEQARAEAAEADLNARKVEGRLEGERGTATIFNEKDGGGALFTGKDEFAGKAAYVGVHDDINGNIGTQIYVDRDADHSTIIDVTENGAYYTTGEYKPASERDVEANEISTKGYVNGKVKDLDDSLAAIAKTGNVEDLIQTEGDVLILQCND